MMMRKLIWVTNLDKTRIVMKHKLLWDTNCAETQIVIQIVMKHIWWWNTNSGRRKQKCHKAQIFTKHKVWWIIKCAKTQNVTKDKEGWKNKVWKTQSLTRQCVKIPNSVNIQIVTKLKYWPNSTCWQNSNCDKT